MRRRGSPYSCIEHVRRSRGELLTLVLTTVVLGILLGLLTDGLSAQLHQAMTPTGSAVFLGAVGFLVLVLTGLAAWLLHGRTESQRVCIEVWVPYHFPHRHGATIARDGAYQPPRHARRAFMRRYRPNSSELEAFLQQHADAQARGELFQASIGDDQRALTQCLALYVLHYYTDRSLGAETVHDWWRVDLKSRRLSMDELPSPLRDNPFLRADQRPDEWRLLLPEAVSFQATKSGWVLRHRRYGYVDVRWFPQLAIAGRRSQPYRALTSYMRLDKDSQLYVVGTRIEAVAQLRWSLLPASEPFHQWAAGLLARLEEALDFTYYTATRPDRVIQDLEWKIGWVPEGTSIVEMLQSIEGRLEELEMQAAITRLEGQGEQRQSARGDREGPATVV